MKVFGILALSCVLVPLTPHETRSSDDGCVFKSQVPAGRRRTDPSLGRVGIAPAALSFFEGMDASEVDSFLTRIRPQPLSPALKAQVIASLPSEGELRPSPKDLRKLAIVEPILKFHQRQGAIEVRLIDVKHAFIGLHARTVLLVSRDALDLVSPPELQALIAHELGHEYFWDDYSRAMADHDEPRMQELELRCDGIAVLTLRQLELDPENLVRAVTTLTRYNERLGAVTSAASYASLGDRVKFIRTLGKRFGIMSRAAGGSPIPCGIPAPSR